MRGRRRGGDCRGRHIADVRLAALQTSHDALVHVERRQDVGRDLTDRAEPLAARLERARTRGVEPGGVADTRAHQLLEERPRAAPDPRYGARIAFDRAGSRAADAAALLEPAGQRLELRPGFRVVHALTGINHGLLRRGLHPHLKEIDPQREGHGEVDVALGYVRAESVGH